LKLSGIGIDFRRIERVHFGLSCLKDYIVNLSTFAERSRICESDEVSKELYDRIEDQLLVIVKPISLSGSLEKSQIENGIENLINLRHPCIACPIGFVFRIESDSLHEVKIVGLYSDGCSLSEVLSVNPVWWTSTVKAKVIAGLVLGLRFAHSLGLFHGDLTTNKILFDLDHCIQIVDFERIQFEVGERENESENGSENESEEATQLGSFSKAGLTRESDIQAFASILFELMFGHPPQGELSIPTDIPDFVSTIIKSGLYHGSETKYSFHDIFEILKQYNFEIEKDVDSAEVSAFVSWVESVEPPEQ
jgi:serine/threonine protein kinase